MLLHTYQLTDAQSRDLKDLIRLCQKADGGLPAFYYPLLRKKRTEKCNVLYYQRKKLVGFLGVYFFYEQAAEISLLVMPQKRRQGIAAQLIKTILPLLQQRQLKELIFSSAPGFNNPFSAKQLHYHHSEYHMERKDKHPAVIEVPLLTIRQATVEDMAQLCLIDEQCFKDQQVNMVQRFLYLLNNQYVLLLASYQNTIVGKAHLNYKTTTIILSDIAILPHYQNRGLGKELIAHSINHALKLGAIRLALDVEASNLNALKLYQQHGFRTTSSYDYWVISLEKLKSCFPAEGKS